MVELRIMIMMNDDKAVLFIGLHNLISPSGVEESTLQKRRLTAREKTSKASGLLEVLLKVEDNRKDEGKIY